MRNKIKVFLIELVNRLPKPHFIILIFGGSLFNDLTVSKKILKNLLQAEG